MKRCRGKILIVDDEVSIRETLKVLLEDADYFVKTASDGFEAIEILKNSDFDLVLCDLRMPKMDGVELFEKIREFDSSVEFVIISAYADIKKAVKAIKMGAFDYLQKNFSTDELLVTVEKALEKKRLLEENRILKKKLEEKKFDEDVVFRSKEIENILKLIDKIAPTKATVLITGESGVGKEVFARLIHKKSDRRKAPFLAVNCAALPDELLESELFGHERGAFTGAVAQKKGKFEIADGGTIFLDEIAEASALMQSKLLRFLQEGEFERVGGLKKIKVNVRVIAATNKDLVRSIEAGEFREDLYYRLNVINLHIPPLRKRKEDIPVLTQYFLNYYNSEYSKNIQSISDETMELLLSYQWPGNVRELKNAVEHAVAVADIRDTALQPRHLPPEITGGKIDTGKSQTASKEGQKVSLEEFEKQHILKVLESVNWNKSLAAKILGINRQTLYNKLRRYGYKV